MGNRYSSLSTNLRENYSSASPDMPKVVNGLPEADHLESQIGSHSTAVNTNLQENCPNPTPTLMLETIPTDVLASHLPIPTTSVATQTEIPAQPSATPVLDFIEIADSAGILDADLFNTCYPKAVNELNFFRDEDLVRFKRIKLLADYYAAPQDRALSPPEPQSRAPSPLEHTEDSQPTHGEYADNGVYDCTSSDDDDDDSSDEYDCSNSDDSDEDNDDSYDESDDSNGHDEDSRDASSNRIESPSTPRSILKSRREGGNDINNGRKRNGGNLVFNENMKVQYFYKDDLARAASVEYTTPTTEAVVSVSRPRHLWLKRNRISTRPESHDDDDTQDKAGLQHTRPRKWIRPRSSSERATLYEGTLEEENYDSEESSSSDESDSSDSSEANESDPDDDSNNETAESLFQWYVDDEEALRNDLLELDKFSEEECQPLVTDHDSETSGHTRQEDSGEETSPSCEQRSPESNDLRVRGEGEAPTSKDKGKGKHSDSATINGRAEPGPSYIPDVGSSRSSIILRQRSTSSSADRCEEEYQMELMKRQQEEVDRQIALGLSEALEDTDIETHDFGCSMFQGGIRIRDNSDAESERLGSSRSLKRRRDQEELSSVNDGSGDGNRRRRRKRANIESNEPETDTNVMPSLPILQSLGLTADDEGQEGHSVGEDDYSSSSTISTSYEPARSLAVTPSPTITSATSDGGHNGPSSTRSKRKRPCGPNNTDHAIGENGGSDFVSLLLSQHPISSVSTTSSFTTSIHPGRQHRLLPTATTSALASQESISGSAGPSIRGYGPRSTRSKRRRSHSPDNTDNTIEESDGSSTVPLLLPQSPTSAIGTSSSIATSAHPRRRHYHLRATSERALNASLLATASALASTLSSQESTSGGTGPNSRSCNGPGSTGSKRRRPISPDNANSTTEESSGLGAVPLLLPQSPSTSMNMQTIMTSYNSFFTTALGPATVLTSISISASVSTPASESSLALVSAPALAPASTPTSDPTSVSVSIPAVAPRRSARIAGRTATAPSPPPSPQRRRQQRRQRAARNIGEKRPDGKRRKK
ncbi:hypothetical protein BGZ80_006350 [Entomortierella chlamydospora]|uniref:Uncharacterized protein n=1 Tax=Entomortierella chlamydospora TaxID=101097 RepID=A0A9P6N033_9FUNG|nr:hypothetical protein BGZ80_006350 [Entomortierella chlamydospora]